MAFIAKIPAAVLALVLSVSLLLFLLIVLFVLDKNIAITTGPMA
ncbi:MAG: hypothetical protein QXK08_00590 [Candidatus Woesearchaeota archaeon]